MAIMDYDDEREAKQKAELKRFDDLVCAYGFVFSSKEGRLVIADLREKSCMGERKGVLDSDTANYRNGAEDIVNHIITVLEEYEERR